MQGWLSLYFTVLLLRVCSCSLLRDLFQDQDKDQTPLAANGQPQDGRDLISFGGWEAIGPFRIGTREAVWGSDPLKAFEAEGRESYPSPLTVNATVKWEPRDFNSSFNRQTGFVDVHLNYDAINWEFLRTIYGWAASQYQAWVRSEILYRGNEPITILFYPTSILEFVWNNQTQFGGDFFGFERAPIVARLNPGRNRIRIRLIRDVRASGAAISPIIDARLRFDLIGRERAVVLPDRLILPDIINGRPASSPASIALCNVGSRTIEVSGVVTKNGRELQLLDLETFIVPGQTKPIGFSLEGLEAYSLPVAIIVQYFVVGAKELYHLDATLNFSNRNMFAPHKITFLQVGGSVSYAVLRPPPQTLPRDHAYNLPIMMNLHGAGVDVDSPQVRHSFDAARDLPCWMLFPTGSSPWSGDDWHTGAMFDIYAALEAAMVWPTTHGWRWPGILPGLIVTGHSNGGQGAWHFAMHHPDHIIAAVMASGYTSIQNYVPYVMWTEADPRQVAVLDAALSSFKHELFMENLQRTPVLVQHGSDDDNVPVYHARLMTALAEQAHINVTFIELQGKGHWFDGAMTTGPLLEFYKEFCTPEARTPPTPSNFSFVVPLSDDVSTKYGIMIDQLQTPDRLGKVVVKSEIRNDGTLLWHIRTANIRRLHFDSYQTLPDAIRLDEWPCVIELDNEFITSTSFVSRGSGNWSREGDFSPSLGQRTGLQRGAMDAILRTQGPFQIIYLSGSTQAYQLAVQVSRNLLQYFGATALIRSSDEYELAQDASGNIVNIVLAAQTPSSRLGSFPIRADRAGIWLRGPTGMRFISSSEGRGAAWLQPLPNERLELVVWGIDAAGLEQAARMAPTLTGVGQPDFVVFSKEAAWKGHGGTLAMGFFDYSWNISGGSFLP